MVRTVAVALSVVFVYGCASPVPVADNFPLSYQKVARTAHHWDVVADDVVAQTADTLRGRGAFSERSLYVMQPARSTMFDAAFRDFLLNRMVDRGMTVNVCSAPSEVQVRYSTRVVQHSANMPKYRPGFLTALTSGVWVGHLLSESSLSADAAYAIGIPFAVAADVIAGHEAEPTRTEIIVTTTITEANHFVMRRSDVYYVPDGDRPIFTAAVARESDCAPDRMRMEHTSAALDLDNGSPPHWRATAERIATVQGCASAEAQLTTRARGREGYAVQCSGAVEPIRVACEEGICKAVMRD